MKCECGNEEFEAHQRLYTDIIVNGDNDFQRSATETIEDSIYESSKPNGPYTCTKCKKVYEELR